MSHNNNVKNPELKIPQSNPSSIILNPSVFINTLLKPDKDRVLNSSEMNAINLNINKETHAKTESIIIHICFIETNNNVNGNQSCACRLNQNELQTQTPSPQPFTRNIQAQCIQVVDIKENCLYKSLCNFLDSKRVIWFYVINILISITFLCTSVAFMIINEIMMVISITCACVCGMNLLEGLGKSYVYGCLTFITKYKSDSILIMIILIMSVIGLICERIFIEESRTIVMSLMIIVGILSILRASLAITNKYSSIRKYNVERKNVEEIIQFETEHGEKSNRKNMKSNEKKINKGGISYIPQVNELNE